MGGLLCPFLAQKMNILGILVQRSRKETKCWEMGCGVRPTISDTCSSFFPLPSDLIAGCSVTLS